MEPSGVPLVEWYGPSLRDAGDDDRTCRRALRKASFGQFHQSPILLSIGNNQHVASCLNVEFEHESLFDSDLGKHVVVAIVMLNTCKAFPVPHLNAVIAASGSLMWSPLILSNLLISVTTYDELKQWAPTLLHKAVFEASHVFVGGGVPEVVLIIAGISETTGPDAFSVTTCERTADPWVVHELSGCALWPATPELQAEFHETYAGITSGDDLDPARAGIRIMEMQRKHPEAIIGGFVQLTSVTRDSISTRIIHRWDEPIVGVQADAA